MIILGIDAGIEGAVAALDGRTGELIGVRDLPVMRDRSIAWIDGGELLLMLGDLRNGRPARAYVERLQAMPRAMGGAHTAISRGLTLGSILATLSIAGIGVELVTPAVWKRSLGLLQPKATPTARKRESLDRARLLYPTAELDRAKHHNRAEALLIAHWGMRDWRGEIATAAA